MAERNSRVIEKSVQLEGTDIEVHVRLQDASMRIKVTKSGVCVHSVVIDHAKDSLENAWLADHFAREDHVELRSLAKEVDDFLMSTNTNQG